MKIKFWGTRGSIATPLPEMMRYGGDTSCVEVITSEGEEIILDAGTGIRQLSKKFHQGKPHIKGATMFLSHLHWDHIQGFPFFTPIYDPHFTFKIYGPMRVDVSLEHRLKRQMSDLFFPVVIEEVSSTLEFESIVEEPVRVGSTVVHPRYQNHPQGSYGYRIVDSGKVLSYCTDNEHPWEEVSEDMKFLAGNSDLLIFDAQYTPEEYETKKGWGHSTWVNAVRIAKVCNVKKLVLFHHDPEHDDAFIDDILAKAQAEFPSTIAAARDLEIDL